MFYYEFSRVFPSHFTKILSHKNQSITLIFPSIIKFVAIAGIFPFLWSKYIVLVVVYFRLETQIFATDNTVQWASEFYNKCRVCSR